MKKKKLIETEISITLPEKHPTLDQLEALKKIFPDERIAVLELWGRETNIQDQG